MVVHQAYISSTANNTWTDIPKFPKEGVVRISTIYYGKDDGTSTFQIRDKNNYIKVTVTSDSSQSTSPTSGTPIFEGFLEDYYVHCTAEYKDSDSGNKVIIDFVIGDNSMVI